MTAATPEFNENSFVSEAQARALCARHAARHPDLPRLKTVAFVGAYDGVIGGPARDSRRLTGIMAYMLRSGFVIDPDFEIDVVNFRDGRDFLKEDKAADVTIVSFILAEKRYRQTYDYGEHLNRVFDQKRWSLSSVFGRALSAEHSEQRWQDRLRQAGTQVAITYGRPLEVNTATLCGGSSLLKSLIPTPPLPEEPYIKNPDPEHLDMESLIDIRAHYNDAGAGLPPTPWLGFAARGDYVKDMAAAMNPGTMLGRAALKLAV